jgi:DNA-binding MarR family transcriptional regulator
VGEVLKQRLQQARFDGIHHEAVLSLLVAAAHVRDTLDRVCEVHGVTRGQFNVLRILRGAHPHGYPRCEIAKRLVERAPDVTRLIDRLERRGLLVRAKADGDRRLSVARITRKGLELLERMQPDVDRTHRLISRHLSDDDAGDLARLCERLFAED